MKTYICKNIKWIDNSVEELPCIVTVVLSDKWLDAYAKDDNDKMKAICKAVTDKVGIAGVEAVQCEYVIEPAYVQTEFKF